MKKLLSETGCNDCRSALPNRANLFASIRSFFRLRRFDPSINRGLDTSTSCPQLHRTSRIQAECVPTSNTRRIQPLKEFANLLRCRAQLSFRQRFSLKTKNAVQTPAVPQIHSYRQTVEIGAKLVSLMLSSALGATTLFRSSFFFSFPTSSTSTSFVSRCTGPLAFVRLEVGSLFFGELLCFFKVDSLFAVIAPWRVR